MVRGNEAVPVETHDHPQSADIPSHTWPERKPVGRGVELTQ